MATGAMFTEEIDKLRFQLVEAQEVAHTSERQAQEMSSKFHQERNRVEGLESRVKQLEAELQQSKTKSSSLRDQMDRLASLESEKEQALSDLRDERERAEKLDKKLKETAGKLAAATSVNADLRSDVTALRTELEPTRMVIAALRARREADRVIAAEIENL